MNIQIEVKSNNASIKSICPRCGDTFKPSLGEWAFKAGTWDALCEECRHQAELDSRQMIQTPGVK